MDTVFPPYEIYCMDHEQLHPAYDFFRAIGLEQESLENFVSNYNLCRSRILFGSCKGGINDIVSFIFHISPDNKTMGKEGEQVFLSSIVVKENGSVIFLGPGLIYWNDDQQELFKNILKEVCESLANCDLSKIETRSHINSLPMFFSDQLRLELKEKLCLYVERFGLNRLIALEKLHFIFRKEKDDTYSAFMSPVKNQNLILKFSGDNVPSEYIWEKDTSFPWRIISFDEKKLSSRLIEFYQQQYFDSLKKISNGLYNQFLEMTKEPIYREMIDMGITNINQSYNWVVEPQNENSRLKRWQAFQASPVFVYCALIQSNKVKQSDPSFKEEFYIDLKGLEETIDQSKELIGFIQAQTKFSPTMIRWINRVKTEVNIAKSRINYSYSFLISIGSFLPIEAYPADKEQTAYFYNYISDINRLGKSYNLRSLNILKNVLEKKENWLWKSRKISRSQIESIKDFTLSFTKQCLYPQIIDRMETLNHAYDQDIIHRIAYKTVNNFSLVERVLTSKYSIPQLVEMSEYWHTNYQRIVSKALITENYFWEPLFETLEIEGVRAESLYSVEMLEQEGKIMNHCVSSYIDKCMLNRAHIVSFKTLEGERISTLEIIADLNSDKIIYYLNQNQGYRNSEPSELAVRAANSLITAINSGEIRVNNDKLKLTSEQRNADYNKNRLLRSIGYDYKKPESRIAAFEAWRFTRKPSEKKLDYQQWIISNNISELIDNAIEMDGSDYSTQTPYQLN